MHQYEQEHLNFVLDNAAECTVLLKSNGAFPLEKPCSLAAYGTGLRHTIKGGTGSGEVNTRNNYTIEESLEREGFEIVTKKWLDDFDVLYRKAHETFIKDIKREALRKFENPIMYGMGKAMPEPEYELPMEARGDAAIYAVSRISGEGNDRTLHPGDALLTKSEIRDILALNRRYEKFMLVLNVGGVVDLSPVAEVSNILLLSQLPDCGKVLADILTGKQNPSGKLSDTWAAEKDYSREGSFGQWDDNCYNEGIYVGYRYFDTFGKKPLFPFGYGLSYTTFTLNTASVSLFGETVTASVTVNNTGAVAGKEVVQLYLSKPAKELDQPYQELAAFKKTELLAPGEAQALEVSFRLSDLASFDEAKSAYVLEQGDYLLRVGNSSASTEIAAVLTLGETVVLKQVRDCLGKPDFTDLRSLPCNREEAPAAAPRLTVDPAAFVPAVPDYDAEYEIDPRAKELTDEELCYFAIGSFSDKGVMSVIGESSTHVAGAAGETTNALRDKGVKALVMADGPAGLRLNPKYYLDEKGAHDATGGIGIPMSMLELMGPVTRWAAKALTGGKKIPADVEILEHYMTMIPIGTAIAQSFNTDLAQAFGDLVGAEMEETGVHLWLAPALNIHRSILCGRNFEYYSEDPLLSGAMAAAITRGVQSHPHCGTTIKHYAVNNAETNRYCNNSQVSPRALREIYLRGFELCIRDSAPHALMTSYNLLNGIHTSEHNGLVSDVLRGEFGYKGIVMTDWVVAGIGSAKKCRYRGALSDEVSKAGGGVFMPGNGKDFARVKAALQDGSLPRKTLEINASRLLRMIDLLAE